MSEPIFTSRDIELLCQPTLASQFPVTFANGVRFSRIEGTCPCCAERFTAVDLCGLVIRQNEHLVLIEASFMCHPCQILNRVVYRLHDSGCISWPDEQGRWRTDVATQTSWVQRLLAAFRNWLDK